MIKIRYFLRLLRTISYLKARQIVWQVYRQISPVTGTKSITPIRLVNDIPSFDGIPWITETLLESGKISLFGDVLPANRATIFVKQDRRYMLPYTMNYLDFLHSSDTSKVSSSELVKVYKFWREHANLDINSAWHPYQASRRLASLIFFYSKFGRTFSLKTRKALIFDLSEHHEFIRRNLEFSIDANHLLTNYWSLALIELYADFSEKFFFERYIDELSDSFIDGFYFERSISYHAIVLWQLLIIYRLSEQKYSEGLEKISLLCTSEEIGNNSELLSQTELFRFGDVVLSSAPDLALLYNCFKEKGLGLAETTESSPTISGFEVLSKGDFVVTVDAGAPSPVFQPGHAHDSTLGVIISIAGVIVIGSMPISTYDRVCKRKVERSARWYSKPIIRGTSTQEVWSSFRVGRRTVPVVKRSEYSCEIESQYFLNNSFLKKPLSVRREIHIFNNLWISDFFPASMQYSKDCYSQFLIPLPLATRYRMMKNGIELDYGANFQIFLRILSGKLSYSKLVHLKLDIEQKSENNFLKVRVVPELNKSKMLTVCIQIEVKNI